MANQANQYNKRRFSPEMREVLALIFRASAHGWRGWSKTRIMEALRVHARDQDLRWQYCAGFMLIEWPDGTSTAHTQRNWWAMKRWIA